MQNLKNNCAYIDGANLHKGIEELGWHLDYFRLHSWLIQKYQINRAYIFLGYVADNKRLYQKLRRAGFVLVFKSLTFLADGKFKGNCDAELVLQAVVDYYENRFNQAILISGDGDFACLAMFLLTNKVLKTIVAPNKSSCSYLIKRIQPPLLFLDYFKEKLAIKRKSPRYGKTVQGSFS
ncbi:MAG: NYN domain-containing protein [Candidatus Komeilibacteria bacterium]|nr:NYN domain-containing protein [Candidatus Komeilibacteria bacterium]